MYGIHDFGDMIADRGRTDAYARALRAHITPESTVLDLGAGSGIFTLLACQAGARAVIAIETDPIIELARELVHANGYADRVRFIQAESAKVTLDEPVDVIVAEIHGALPFFCQSPASLFDARMRFLKPGGTMIPLADAVYVAVVNAPREHQLITGPWNLPRGLDGTPGRRRAVNVWGQRRFPPDALVVEPAPWLTLDYQHGARPSAQGSVSWTATRASEAHGLCLWFDCETAPGIAFSNSPLLGEAHVFGQAFFPWPDACPINAGDRIQVGLRADFVGEDYLWSWDTTIAGDGGGDRPRVRFTQRHFSSVLFTEDWLRKTASSFVPSPNVEAAVDMLILDLLGRRTRLDEIARRIAEQFPARFPTARDALTRVGRFSMKYSD